MDSRSIASYNNMHMTCRLPLTKAAAYAMQCDFSSKVYAELK